ncbi:DUF2779 domain-containing protein [Aquirufa sp. OSTEICH-129V]|uniref:DUF2779 domain-containing protein n=1 Tax=Aquirufa avitistagni TaxID=3104728 RepID=A0ABW6DCF4_9BACT
MSKPQYLSKSDFQLASSCAKKLVYKKKGYDSSNDTDEYMMMLAQGGYIVGKMATMLFPDGIEVEGSTAESLQKTKEHIEKYDSITLFEPAFEYNQRLARIDIFVKHGNKIQLIEVKSASRDSLNPKKDSNKLNKYIQDISFQYTILKDVFPDCEITCLLLMPDKSMRTLIDGLAGWFRLIDKSISQDEEYEAPNEIISRETSKFQKPEVEFVFDNNPNRQDYIDRLRNEGILNYLDVTEKAIALESGIRAKAESYIKILNNGLEATSQDYEISKSCKSCEYYVSGDANCGFLECWKGVNTFPSIFDLYYGGTVGSNNYLNELIKDRKYEFRDIQTERLCKNDGSIGTRNERQIIQFENTVNKKEWISETMIQELDSWIYPLHFIDFETYTGALPFHQGMRPFELIAFQWSCHTIDRPDAEPRHQEFIYTDSDFPNFKFAESLMKHIGMSGTPLMWATHENSVLRTILYQMDEYGYQNPALKDWLQKTIKDKDLGTEGRFIDMNAFTLKHYFHPEMKGKTSIKKVLPAIWNNNQLLHEIPYLHKYSIKDLEQQVLDPYDTLFNLANEKMKSVDEEIEIQSEDVKGGTGAMRAFYRIRFDNSITKEHKEELKHRLLEYCKLDTMAMVIIWLYWKQTVR